ncbi:elongation factor Ts [Angomonas deanei]|uniref:Elongation factor Ts, mitochondrial n=1 Tax=Angomonas deanei TaxID=59799 RepID=S9VBU1_9TRYP|nr:elongation factor Ts [Angomonas deanei]EPY38459.1 elongation factor Ts [Angomonas deanei]EPY40459.1 elongation factor Ts [Angomonas deanei]EPY41092.1 elongation factor Ts [Angomonas deanei]EPY42146.1 elongation factor Ts [Angomonas deanei]|eukprot:EPY32577.1 elongation factor Ts [Angomonas deanei]
MFRRTALFLELPTDRKAFMELVKVLRFRTEAPITDCTSALKEANGDLDAAAGILQKKGAARAMKKGDRATNHGFVVSCVSHNPAHGAAILTVSSETDFAARNEHFQKMCVTLRQKLLDQLESTKGKFMANPEEAAKLLGEQCLPDLQAATAVMGENVRVSSITPLNVLPEVAENLCICSYTHGGIGTQNVGRIVGLVAVSPAEQTAPPVDVQTALARHFVCTAGAEGQYNHQKFFGAEEYTIGKWLKKHNLKFNSSLVLEFGKEPVVHVAREAAPPNKK